MARPFEKKSVKGATTATKGEGFGTQAHRDIALVAVAENLDAANDTVEIRLEGAVRVAEHEEAWASIGSPTISASDFEQDESGHYAAYAKGDDLSINRVRAAVTSLTDAANNDLSVDVYLTATGNASGMGASFERSGEYAEEF